MIEITLSPPTKDDRPEIIDGDERTASTTIDMDSGLGETVVFDQIVGKYVYERKARELATIVTTLSIIPCNANIRCTIGGGKWEAAGTIRIWSEEYRLLAEEAVQAMEDLAIYIADKCRKATFKLTYTLKRTEL